MLTLENATFSHGGRVPFSFSYRDLYRVAPDPGGYVKVQSRWPDGALKYSYAVDPLLLPRLLGELVGRAAAVRGGLHPRAAPRATPGFALRGEGKATVNTSLSGYEVALHGRRGRPGDVRARRAAAARRGRARAKAWTS